MFQSNSPVDALDELDAADWTDCLRFDISPIMSRVVSLTSLLSTFDGFQILTRKWLKIFMEHIGIENSWNSELTIKLILFVRNLDSLGVIGSIKNLTNKKSIPEDDSYCRTMKVALGRSLYKSLAVDSGSAFMVELTAMSANLFLKCFYFKTVENSNRTYRLKL